MILIVGLGNPGEKYEQTRHNLGFMAVNRFMQEYEPVKQTGWSTNEKLKSDIVQLDWQPKQGEMKRVLLALPRTFMNNSGMAVSLLANFYKVDPSDIWIVHDELDLPLGAMRIRFGGAGAGHRGVESVIERLGTDKFWRFRLGIGMSHHYASRSGEDEESQPISREKISNVEEYVLSNFSQEDHGKTRELLKRASNAMQYALEKDLEGAMNKYNTK